MRKYYTRPCNFYYGSYARSLIAKKKAFPIAGNPNIAFDQIEIFQRKQNQVVESKFCSITEIKNLDKRYSSDFTIYDDSDQKLILKEIIEELDLNNYKEFNPNLKIKLKKSFNKKDLDIETKDDIILKIKDSLKNGSILTDVGSVKELSLIHI